MSDEIAPIKKTPITGGWRGQWYALRQRRSARWSVYVLVGMLVISFLADFIANDQPIYCKIDGEHHFPVFHQYGVDLNLTSWEARFVQKEWEEHNYQASVMPLIPYSSKSIDLKNTNFKGPFAAQNYSSLRYRHWLGTDLLGRDVAAGMIYGLRIAMMVSIFAMLIASLLGIFMGSIAGYFGDRGYKTPLGQLLTVGLSLPLGIFYGFIARRYAITETAGFWIILKGILIFMAIVALFYLLGRGLSRLPFFAKKITLPLDAFVMRFIEIFNSIPGLFILLAILSVLQTNSIFNVILIIGILGWTRIARFTRAELMRIKEMEFVQAARSMGYPTWQIILRHSLPNALTPVLITIAFGMAGAILAEATISFLGIGVPVDAFTWGKMLNIARSNFSAWWLVVFPGLGIFVSVTVFNLIGDALSRSGPS